MSVDLRLLVPVLLVLPVDPTLLPPPTLSSGVACLSCLGAAAGLGGFGGGAGAGGNGCGFGGLGAFGALGAHMIIRVY